MELELKSQTNRKSEEELREDGEVIIHKNLFNLCNTSPDKVN